MKNIVKKILVLSTLPMFLILWSCEDFFQKEPYYATSTENALSSYNNMRIAMTGVYSLMTNSNYLGRNYIVAADVQADDANIKVSNSNRMTNQYKFAMASTYTDASYLWGVGYRIINQCNQIIENIGNATDGTQAQRDQLKGEALATRAMVHFDMVRMFAQPYNLPASASAVVLGTPNGNGGHIGVMLVTQTNDDPFTLMPPRATVKAVYDQVLTDLASAAQLMTIGTSPIYWTSKAATALMARVKLYKGDWAGAAADATTVIGGTYKLYTKDNFIQSWKKESQSESIFEIQMTSTTYNGTNALGYMYDSRGYGDFVASNALLNLFETGDIRATKLNATGSKTGPPDGDCMFYKYSTFTYNNKYPGRDNTVGLDNVKILRLSEMYLIRAEANLNAGTSVGKTPLEDINAIRVNRNVPALTVLTSKDISDERRRELCFEGHRFFDIIRKGENLARGTDYWNSRDMAFPNAKFVWPIPQMEIDVNSNLAQNPTY